MNQTIPSVDKITLLHDQRITYWKNNELMLEHQDFYGLVEQNHSWNFQLWQAEDRARREDKGFEFVYHAKRAIDKYNQQRNNMMETMDEWLFKALNPSNAPECPIHSETPGMIIDRLSILSLKIYHMRLQIERTDVDATHLQTCKNKYHTLNAQRNQLSQCLQELLMEVSTQKRTFKVYHQFKMYNDPNLNPELYNSKHHNQD
jgi:hypothetical protein